MQFCTRSCMQASCLLPAFPQIAQPCDPSSMFHRTASSPSISLSSPASRLHHDGAHAQLQLRSSGLEGLPFRPGVKSQQGLLNPVPDHAVSPTLAGAPWLRFLDPFGRPGLRFGRGRKGDPA